MPKFGDIIKYNSSEARDENGRWVSGSPELEAQAKAFVESVPKDRAEAGPGKWLHDKGQRKWVHEDGSGKHGALRHTLHYKVTPKREHGDENLDVGYIDVDGGWHGNPKHKAWTEQNMSEGAKQNNSSRARERARAARSGRGIPIETAIMYGAQAASLFE